MHCWTMKCDVMYHKKKKCLSVVHSHFKDKPDMFVEEGIYATSFF